MVRCDLPASPPSELLRRDFGDGEARERRARFYKLKSDSDHEFPRNTRALSWLGEERIWRGVKSELGLHLAV